MVGSLPRKNSIKYYPPTPQTDLYTYQCMFHLMLMMADNYPITNVPAPTFGSQDSSVSSLYAHGSNFEASGFFELSDWIEENPAFSSHPAGYNPQTPIFATNETVVNSSGISSSSFQDEGTMNRDSGGSKEKKEVRVKVAFKTKSEIEILDDGFKWRKYGKKMVKNSPNPRNYYKCSVEGCSVKKRVERDNNDPQFVVTTYEGVHNHQGPQI